MSSTTVSGTRSNMPEEEKFSATDEGDARTEESDMAQPRYRYVIVSAGRGGVIDILRAVLSWDKALDLFVKVGGLGEWPWPTIEPGYRWDIMVSILVRKALGVLAKPMQLFGFVVEFLLNLLSLNGGLLCLAINALRGTVVIPMRGSDAYFTIIGHLDERIELYQNVLDTSLSIESRSVMDLCVLASKLAYENANVISNIVIHHWKMHFTGFYNCWNEYQKENSTQVFIICDKPTNANLILVSFRGTEPFDADGWITDFDYSWYEIPELGKVHMGFLEALGLGTRNEPTSFYNRLQQRTSKLVANQTGAYDAVKLRLQTLLDENNRARFIVTGHSLGGALAVLLPALLCIHKEVEIMKKFLGVYTFGQPRIGDVQLQRYMEAHICHPVMKYYRVVYCNDIVPRLPYDNNTFLFKHFGACLYYNSCYLEQDVDEVPNRNFFGLKNAMFVHMNAVWELIRSLVIGYTRGPQYKEGWFSMFFRLVGLALPGFTAHSPRDYVNSVRLGRRIQMVPLS